MKILKNLLIQKENSKIIQKDQLKEKESENESKNNDKGRVSFRQKARILAKSKKIVKENKIKTQRLK